MLEDQNSLRKSVEMIHKEKVNINRMVELNKSQESAIEALKKDGFTLAEIITAAIIKLNPKRELKQIKKALGEDEEENNDKKSSEIDTDLQKDEGEDLTKEETEMSEDLTVASENKEDNEPEKYSSYSDHSKQFDVKKSAFN